MYSPQTILSKNIKTGCSINLPIKGHCTPTKNCAHDCYGKCGHTVYPVSLRKQKYVSDYLKNNDLSRLITECQKRTAVRISGVGDLLIEHVNNIINLAKACPNTMFWGMTRKINIANAINHKLPNLKLLLSVDASSPSSVWNYPDKICFGPRRANDSVPDDPRIQTVFPRHFAGRIVGPVPYHRKDCPAVRHTVSGCLECGHCWKW